MLEALPLVLKLYPDTKLYISGIDNTKSGSLNQRLRMGSYGKYLKKRISRLNLEKHISFTGIMDERQMRDRYLKSNVFVLPSVIENSPNSLGEAMLLGVPCIAADVGGVADMLTNKIEGFLYPFDEPYMLAHYICTIFGSTDTANKFSKNARIHALDTHDRQINCRRLVEIYKSLV